MSEVSREGTSKKILPRRGSEKEEQDLLPKMTRQTSLEHPHERTCLSLERSHGRDRDTFSGQLDVSLGDSGGTQACANRTEVSGDDKPDAV